MSEKHAHLDDLPKLSDRGPTSFEREKQLRAELYRQWEYNHSEHCGGRPAEDHEGVCHWPVPDILKP